MKTLSVVLAFVLVFVLSTTPSLAGYGTAPNINKAPTCNSEKPGQAQFSFVQKSGRNQIEVGWNAVARATSWTIAYGTESGKYVYGMADFGNNQSRSVKINMLPAGTYYLVIKANNNCMPGNFSNERKIIVSQNGEFREYKRFSFFTRPSITQETDNSDIVIVPTITPTAYPTPITTITPQTILTPEKQLGLFQRIWRFFFGA